MNKIKQTAWKTLIDYNIQKPLTLNDLKGICESNGWELYSYFEGKEYFEKFDLEGLLENNGFTQIIHEYTTIFYNENIPDIQILITIAHEIGHILLHMNNNDTIGTISITDWQDKEADAFAYELIFPTVVFKKVNLSDNQFIQLELTDAKGLQYYHKQNNSKTINIDLEYTILHNYSAYIVELNAKSKILKKSKLSRIFYNIHKIFNNIIKHYKTTILLCITIILFITALNLKNQQNNSILSAHQLATDSQKTFVHKNLDKDTIVYITKSGEKYHFHGCQYIKFKSNLIPVTIEEAEKSNYMPCKICIK